eukprot:12066978-Alexandrium_andersonii.AAC.1
MMRVEVTNCSVLILLSAMPIAFRVNAGRLREEVLPRGRGERAAVTRRCKDPAGFGAQRGERTAGAGKHR